MKFIVRKDYRKSTTWGHESRRAFGERNEGLLVEADTAAAALRAVGDAHGLNPFYLEAVPVRELDR